jgi:hypothetical protein
MCKHRIYFMNAKLNSDDLRRYALRGAEARLLELGKEAASIYQTFPELRKRGGRSVPDAPSAVTTRASRRRRGRTMSPAQREEVSARMKRYWAQRRNTTTAAQGGEATPATAGKAAGRASKAVRKSAKSGRRKMSAAARKRISDAQKARWAKRKKANA